MEEILLNKTTGKQQNNVNNSLTVELKNRKRNLPLELFNTELSEFAVYNSERESTNLIRLTVNINTIASNVLFNRFTEPVKDEGSEDVIPYLFDKDAHQVLEIEDVIGKDTDYYQGSTDIPKTLCCTQDTQLSKVFDYHCGSDIFNNHMLRSLTFKTSVPPNSNKDTYNTILAEMYQYKGDTPTRITDVVDSRKGINDYDRVVKLHVYRNEDVLSYEDCVKKKMYEENGWFGFLNKGTMQIPTKNGEIAPYLPLMNKNTPSCTFVNLYPERDKFNFVPLYNSFKAREEKNWHYCLTYPSSSTTDGFNFISQYTKGLKAVYYDDTENCKIWSISKHGLSKGDLVNVYKTYVDENGKHVTIKPIESSKVLEIVDDFTFIVESGGAVICNKWLSVDDEIKESIEGNKYYYTDEFDNVTSYYVLYGTSVLFDNAEISFKRVLGAIECDYYVRIFSRVPNWKTSDELVTNENLNKLLSQTENVDNLSLPIYQNYKHDFANTIGQLGFARNIYNDPIAQIVYTDDIDLSCIKDNLGRPVSSLYFTIIKNNEGYRDWYGIDTKERDWKESGEEMWKKDSVEFSHCFGRLSCGMEMSKESRGEQDISNLAFITEQNNDIKHSGYNVKAINSHRLKGIDEDKDVPPCVKQPLEICYKHDINFYGDLCCYNSDSLSEYSIQPIYGRFNTAQRELTSKDGSFASFNNGDLVYDEIAYDDYDAKQFEELEKGKRTITNAIQAQEGYCYKMHYEIPIKSICPKISTITPSYLSIIKIYPTDENGETFRVRMINTNAVGLNQEFLIQDTITLMRYRAVCVKILNYKNIIVKIYNDITGEEINDPSLFVEYDTNKEKFKFFKKHEDIPDYATLANDGSCIYRWREIIQNGMDAFNHELETYPFTNGRIYVNKQINLFVKRQDPDRVTDINDNSFPNDNMPKKEKEYNNNVYKINTSTKC